MPDPVAIMRCKGDNDYSESLKQGLELIGGIHSGGLPVLVKPNLCVSKPSSSDAVTSPKLVKAVVDYVLEVDAGSSISIVESDSDNKWVDEAYRNFGYVDMVDDYRAAGRDVKLVNLSREPAVEISTSFLSKPLRLPKMLLEPNRYFFISVAKAKTHPLTDITGILKNQFGCIPRKDKLVYHRSLDKVIVEVNHHVTPGLCVIDAVTVMEGVIRGRLKNIGVLILGGDAASADAALARVMGMDPEKIVHLALASGAGLGSLHPSLVGVPVDDVAVHVRGQNYFVRGAERMLRFLVTGRSGISTTASGET
ncbi:MAG: DUF362 domain-containing protein [Thaumarchaeota archaeon]|nr:DUF362 domain-containing protein [Nitrososphaerota archaeon]MCL5319071.1 DUF362 domain-containing protein [Nitrososphaerota archaeon]